MNPNPVSNGFVNVLTEEEKGKVNLTCSSFKLNLEKNGHKNQIRESFFYLVII